MTTETAAARAIATATPAVVLVDTTVDSHVSVRLAIDAVRQAAASSALSDALVCLSLQSLQWALQRACADCGRASTPRRLVECINRWLPRAVGSWEAAARHLRHWSDTKRVYATEEDSTFRQQLFTDMRGMDSQAVQQFSMQLLRFLHAEWDGIAAVWTTPAARHSLWRQLCLSNQPLPSIILHVGQQLSAATAPSATSAKPTQPVPVVFHAWAQRIFEQQLKTHLLSTHPRPHADISCRQQGSDDDHGRDEKKMEADGSKQKPSPPSQTTMDIESAADYHLPAHGHGERKAMGESEDEGESKGGDGSKAMQHSNSALHTPSTIARYRPASGSRSSGKEKQKTTKKQKKEEESQLAAPTSDYSTGSSPLPVAGESSSALAQPQPLKQLSSFSPQEKGSSPLSSLPSSFPPVGGEFVFSPTEALRVVAPVSPLTAPLPFHPAVRAQLGRFGIAIVKPPYMDQHTLQQALDSCALQPKNYRHAYRMTLACFNEQQEVDVDAVQAAIDSKDNLSYDPVPPPDEVLALLEEQWQLMSASSALHPTSDAPAAAAARSLPHLSGTEDRIYVKDVSATHDAREGGSVSFFPELDQAYNNFLNEHDGARMEAQSAMEIDTSASDSLERLHTTTDEYEKDEDYRISAKQKRRHVIDALESSQESKSYLFHPLYQDEHALHPSSLSWLCPSNAAGIEQAFAYIKMGYQFFNLHVEQMLFPFLHHQIYGDSLWVLIPLSERDKLATAINELVTTRAAWLSSLHEHQRHDTESDRLSISSASINTMLLSRIAFYSKSLFPPLSLLQKHDVQYYCVTLTSGQVLLAHGGFAHYGFSTTAGETLSLASNLFTQEWLTEGGPQFLVDYGVWVQQLAALEDEVGRAEFEELLSSHGLTLDQLANALNVCPPAYTCQLLRALKAELQDHLHHPERCVCGPHTLTSQEATSVFQLLLEAHHLLHTARPFLERYYVDPSSEYFQVCSCTSSNDSGMGSNDDNASGNNDDASSSSSSSFPANLSTVGQVSEADLNQGQADHEPSIVSSPPSPSPSRSPSSPVHPPHDTAYKLRPQPQRLRRRIIIEDDEDNDNDGSEPMDNEEEQARRLTAAITLTPPARSHLSHSHIHGQSGQASDAQLEELCRVIDPQRVGPLMTCFASHSSSVDQSLDATPVLGTGWTIRSLSSSNCDCFFYALAVLHSTTVQRIKNDIDRVVKEELSEGEGDLTIRAAVLAALDCDPSASSHKALGARATMMSEETNAATAAAAADDAADNADRDDLVKRYSRHLWSETSFGGAFEATILSHHPRYQHLQIFSISWHEGGGVVPLGRAAHANQCAFVAWVHKNHYALLWRLPTRVTATCTPGPDPAEPSKPQVIFPLLTTADIQAVAARFGKQLAGDRLPPYTDDEVMEITASH